MLSEEKMEEYQKIINTYITKEECNLSMRRVIKNESIIPEPEKIEHMIFRRMKEINKRRYL
jgi:hypothetical protein